MSATQNDFIELLNPAAYEAVYLAELINADRVDVDNREQLIDFLLGAISGTPQVNTLAFVTPDLQVTGVHRQSKEILSFDESKDPVAQTSIADLATRSKGSWGPLVYVPTLRQTVLNFREPVFKDGKFIEVGNVEDLSSKYEALKTIDAEGKTIVPGFIDAHIHIESSMLVPSEFAKIAVIHGTVATVSDPHEIANVLGVKGVDFMIENGKKVPLKFNFGAPSCVPATSFESAGAIIAGGDVVNTIKSGIIDPNFTNNMNAVGWCSIASLRNTGNYVHATILTDTTSKCRAQSLINANTGEDSIDIGVANYGDLA